MSITLTCPLCGKRNGYEFRFGGEEKGPRPVAHELTARQWADYFHMNENVFGMQEEWWCHRDGCGVWFTTWRDLKTGLEVKGPRGDNE